MKCRQIQDMIITDYLDGQIIQEKKILVDAHLEQCQICRKFLATARETVVAPFEHSETQYPPEVIWQRVKQAITEGQTDNAPSCLKDFLERLKEALALPRAVQVLATVTIVLLVTVALPKMIMFRGQQSARVSREEQVEYLAYLSGEADTTAENGNGGYGTDIEEYFL